MGAPWARGACSAAWALAWCACAAAAPADPPAPAPPHTPVYCNPVMLRAPMPKPHNAFEYEAAVVHAARALSDLVERNEATEEAAASMARLVATTDLGPPPAAVALGAPRLHIGVLYLTHTQRLFIFQQNNTDTLKQFWRTLASPWNASTVLWSNGWLACDERAGWWSGAAAARGAWPVRAAAALFYRAPAVPCDATYDHDTFLGDRPPDCDMETSLCEAVTTFVTDAYRLEYRCKCRAGYWHPEGEGWFNTHLLPDREVGGRFSCMPCEIDNHAACLGNMYRAALFATNLAGMLLCLIIGFIIFKKRKCKAVAMGMWTVLEVVLLGALLMYGSAASQYISSATWRCVSGAWFRELGFVACYGSVVLRLWVLLAEFRTRKAHRWTPRDSEVLRVVGAMLCGATCYLAAFTATAACEASEAGAEGVAGCARAAWHHVTATAELLLLAAGVRIAYAARNANVPFQERGWLSAALCCEGICGAAWRVAALVGAAPEKSPLAATARAHLSSGAALACVLAPRLWHGYRARSLAQEVSRRGPAEGFGVEGEEEPTSEEVRAELKRLYVQLEILRNKTLRRDNPHISKRRGGRKPPHRRFSLQALQARRGGKGKAGGSASAVEASEAGDASRTPEDSVCSNEGPSHYTDGDTQA